MKTRTSWREKLEKHQEPKVVDIPPRMTRRFGTGKMLIPRPLDVDALIRRVRKGELVTQSQIRERLAKDCRADVTCPITAGIFVRIAAEAAEEDRRAGKKQITPYWRVVRDDGSLNDKLPGGAEAQARRLREEGHRIEAGTGKKPPRVAVLRLKALLAALLALLPAGVRAQPSKLKVYISVDMEGVAGTVTADQLLPTGFEYQRFREFMTREAMAAVTAAKASGATEILVSDSHGNGENLMVELFPPDVRIIRSWPRRQAMMAGIDSSFDAAIFIGYHASTNNPKGVRAHTYSSATLTRVALNGSNVTEGAFAAAIAGQWGVPVVMMSGDDAAIEEVRAAVGNIEAAETKRHLGFHAASTLTPQASYELIGQRVKAALGRRKDFRPYVLKTPVTMDVSFKNYMPAEVLAYLRNVERIDSHSIRFIAKDVAEASDFLQFVTTYNIGLTP